MIYFRTAHTVSACLALVFSSLYPAHFASAQAPGGAGPGSTAHSFECTLDLNQLSWTISSHESNIAIVQHRREINRGMCDLRFDIEDTCLCKAPTKVVLSSECPSGYPNPTPQCTEPDVVIQGFVFHKGSYYTLPEWPNPFGTVYDVPCNITAGEALRRIRSDIYSDFRQNKLKGHCEVACRKKMPEWLDKFSGPDDASQFDEHHPEPNWGGLGAGTYTCAPDCRNYGTAPRGSNRPSAYCADLK